jgi:hypothetical protein
LENIMLGLLTSNPVITENVVTIAVRLNKTTGKYDADEMLALFMEDETLNIDARLLVADLVEDDYKSAFAGRRSYNFTHGVVSRIQIELVRAGHKDALPW